MSVIVPADFGNILLLKTIDIYKTKKKIHAVMTKYIKTTIKSVTTKASRWRKKKVKALIVRSNIYYLKSDGFRIKFFNTGVIPLKRRMNPVNKKLLGPTLLSFKLKKFRTGLTAII